MQEVEHSQPLQEEKYIEVCDENAAVRNLHLHCIRNRRMGKLSVKQTLENMQTE